MSLRKNAFIFALAAAALSTAHAASAGTWVGGELGFVDAPIQSPLTRAQVRQQLLAFRADPVAADGAKFVNGEIGYVAEQHALVRVGQVWVCVDNIAHNAKPDAAMSPGQRRALLEQYPA